MKITVHPKYQSAYPFIASLPSRFETEGETLHASRNVVKKFRTSHGEWIVKRYKKPHLIQQLAYTCWRKSKAQRAFLYADRLREMGIDTPQNIAYIECREHGLFHTGYFVSTVCNDPPLFPALVPCAHFDKRLASSLAAFFVSMHQKGFLHGDPNLKNILYHTDKAGGFHFAVIDTNRSTFKADASQKDCLKNLKRITHRRDLLQYITEEYASLRQWDMTRSVQQVMEALDKFEKRNKIKNLLHNKIKETV